MSQKLHDNERIKIESDFLRGKLVEGLNDNKKKYIMMKICYTIMLKTVLIMNVFA